MFGKKRKYRKDRSEIVKAFDPVIQSKLDEMDAYNKKMESLVSLNPDYAFIQYLINQVSLQNKVKIDVHFKCGDDITIRQDRDDDTYRRDGIE